MYILYTALYSIHYTLYTIYISPLLWIYYTQPYSIHYTLYTIYISTCVCVCTVQHYIRYMTQMFQQCIRQESAGCWSRRTPRGGGKGGEEGGGSWIGFTRGVWLAGHVPRPDKARPIPPPPGGGGGGGNKSPVFGTNWLVPTPRGHVSCGKHWYQIGLAERAGRVKKKNNQRRHCALCTFLGFGISKNILKRATALISGTLCAVRGLSSCMTFLPSVWPFFKMSLSSSRPVKQASGSAKHNWARTWQEMASPVSCGHFYMDQACTTGAPPPTTSFVTFLLRLSWMTF